MRSKNVLAQEHQIAVQYIIIAANVLSFCTFYSENYLKINIFHKNFENQRMQIRMQGDGRRMNSSAYNSNVCGMLVEYVKAIFSNKSE